MIRHKGVMEQAVEPLKGKVPVNAAEANAQRKMRVMPMPSVQLS